MFFVQITVISCLSEVSTHFSDDTINMQVISYAASKLEHCLCCSIANGQEN